MTTHEGESVSTGPVLTSAASVAAFPLGGIGTGNVSLGSRGDLRDWEIANQPNKGAWLPYTFFAIRAQPRGQQAVSSVLEARLPPPHTGDNGLYRGRGAGLPRLRDTRMRGEYPITTVEFLDELLPVKVTLTAFTPLVPLDSDDSGMPAAVLRYRVHNPRPEAVEVTIAGSMANPIGIVGRDQADAPRFAGTPDVRYRDSGDLRGLEFGTDLPDTSPHYGSATLTTTDIEVTVTEQWLIGARPDGAQLFWEDFTSDGRLEPTGEHPPDPGGRDDGLRIGSLGIVHPLAPGAEQDFEFLLTWHVPNRRKAWQGSALPDTNIESTIRNHYAVRYRDAWHVAHDLALRLPYLESTTRAFHDALFSSTMPSDVVDAVTATLVVLRSTTCLLLEDGTPEGRFAAWEGSLDHAGSCEGTCTHVWNYAQTAAYLFPSLERSARCTEFLRETLPDGRMRFRSNSVFDGEPYEFPAAVDGQLGTIVRLYREWVLSGDDTFLARLWPHAQRALEYAFAHWDANSDLVLDSEQHNTYDIEFFGENSLANSMFLAALRAGAEMAEHLGDHATAQHYRDTATLSAERMDQMLFNGEYYVQRLDRLDERRYQYGAGCLADQLFGQTLAHLNGLGHLLPVDHVRSAVSAVHRYNFRPDLASHASVQRTYAVPGEAGLVLCSWPDSGRPQIPFIYCDEVWSGIEYQVATHLIFEGFTQQGLEVVRAVRDRHDGLRRNPWNEVECGNHYARSLASWGVLIALLGQQWDGRTRTLRLTPREEALSAGHFVALVTTDTGWGVLQADHSRAWVICRGGRLQALTVTFDHPGNHSVWAAASVDLAPGESAALTAS